MVEIRRKILDSILSCDMFLIFALNLSREVVPFELKDMPSKAKDDQKLLKILLHSHLTTLIYSSNNLLYSQFC